MSDKPNKNGDIFKTEYMGRWLDSADPIKLLDDDPPTTFEHRIGKHRNKPCADPWPILEQHGHGIRPGEFLVLGGARTAPRTVVACDPCIPDSERTVVTVGDALPGGQFNVRFQMEVTAEQLEFMKRTVGQTAIQGAASDMAELAIARPHPLHVYEELLKEKQAEYRRSLVGRLGDLFPDTKETQMNKDDILKVNPIPMLPLKSPAGLRQGPSMGCNVMAGPIEQVGKFEKRELDALKVEPVVLYRAEVLPKRESDNLTNFMWAEQSEVDHGSNHMVAITLVSPNHLPPGTMLRLVPHYGARPVAKEPAPELLKRLAAAMDLPIDGYATWEGVVGFTVEAVADMKKQNRRLLEQSARWEADAQRERQRANRAADAAGNATAGLERERHTFALTVAEMQLELRRMRKKVGER